MAARMSQASFQRNDDTEAASLMGAGAMAAATYRSEFASENTSRRSACTMTQFVIRNCAAKHKGCRLLS